MPRPEFATRKEIPLDVRYAVYARAGRHCEFCGMPSTPVMNLHHRWYPDEDTAANLICVHRLCHEAIHFGRSIKARKSSLVAQGDTGKNDTPLWRAYLASKTHD